MKSAGFNEAFPRPEGRSSVLTKTRNQKMARSAHAYVRGNTLKFYEWLEGLKANSLPNGPPVWICGDCHVGNLGPVANSSGHIEIQICDWIRPSSATRRTISFAWGCRSPPPRVAPTFPA
jgi:uncharacterized protein (DUF2252 family)